MYPSTNVWITISIILLVVVVILLVILAICGYVLYRAISNQTESEILGFLINSVNFSDKPNEDDLRSHSLTESINKKLRGKQTIKVMKLNMDDLDKEFKSESVDTTKRTNSSTNRQTANQSNSEQTTKSLKK